MYIILFFFKKKNYYIIYADIPTIEFLELLTPHVPWTMAAQYFTPYCHV